MAEIEFDELGQAQWAVGIIQEITDRKNNERALEEANEKLKHLAMIDGLTQIANRRKFDESLENEWLRMCRRKEPLSLIIFDVDHFKQYNDTYGHQAGDNCLQTIAKVASEFVKRPGDLIARYGGEEFVCILSNTARDNACKLADKICRKIEKIEIPNISSPIKDCVTVSCGVSTVIPMKTMDSLFLLRGADNALYCAKETGRNRYCFRSYMEYDSSP